MAYVWATWMAAEFRAAGLDVVEVDGWRTRGRPASSGPFNPYGLNVHHTGGTSSALSPTPALSLLVGGRSDLPGPIAHFATDWHGRIWVIAAGRANVNGANRGVPNFPGRDGNRDLMGNEVFTNGTQTLPQAQLDAIALSSIVVLDHFGKSIDGHLYRHQDTSKTGKWDIGQLTTPALRTITKAALRGKPPTPKEDDVTPEDIQKIALAVVNQTITKRGGPTGPTSLRQVAAWWESHIGQIKRDTAIARALAEAAAKANGPMSAADVTRIAEAVEAKVNADLAADVAGHLEVTPKGTP